MMNRFFLDWFNNLTQNVGIQTKNAVHVCRICKSPEVFSKSSSKFVFHKLSAFCREVAFVSESWYIIEQKIGLEKLSLKLSSFGVYVSKTLKLATRYSMPLLAKCCPKTIQWLLNSGNASREWCKAVCFILFLLPSFLTTGHHPCALSDVLLCRALFQKL